MLTVSDFKYVSKNFMVVRPSLYHACPVLGTYCVADADCGGRGAVAVMGTQLDTLTDRSCKWQMVQSG